MKNVTLELIKSFSPCYNPEKIGFTKDLELTPIEFIEQFSDKVRSKSDVVWLLCRVDFITLENIVDFAKWCAKDAKKSNATAAAAYAAAYADKAADAAYAADTAAYAAAYADKAADTAAYAADAADKAAAYADKAADAADKAAAYADKAADARNRQIEQLKTYYHE